MNWIQNWLLFHARLFDTESNLDYPDYSIVWTFFSGPVFSWILISGNLENLKLQIDRLNPFKRLSKQRIIFVRKWDEKFFKQTSMIKLHILECYEHLNKKRLIVNT